MPIYEYVCGSCQHRFEVKQRISDPPVSSCGRCGQAVTKVISAPAIMFKGSGWYVTDYSDKLKPPGQTESAGKPSNGQKEPASKEAPAQPAAASPAPAQTGAAAGAASSGSSAPSTGSSTAAPASSSSPPGSSSTSSS